jgi:hypothetical protein
MIATTGFERHIVRERVNDRKKVGIKGITMPSFRLTPVVAFELSGPFNRPHPTRFSILRCC